jgi:hypothetical protein
MPYLSIVMTCTPTRCSTVTPNCAGWTNQLVPDTRFKFILCLITLRFQSDNSFWPVTDLIEQKLLNKIAKKKPEKSNLRNWVVHHIRFTRLNCIFIRSIQHWHTLSEFVAVSRIIVVRVSQFAVRLQ